MENHAATTRHTHTPTRGLGAVVEYVLRTKVHNYPKENMSCSPARRQIAAAAVA